MLPTCSVCGAPVKFDLGGYSCTYDPPKLTEAEKAVVEAAIIEEKMLRDSSVSVNSRPYIEAYVVRKLAVIALLATRASAKEK